MCPHELFCRRHSDLCRLFQWKMIDACGDRRKCDPADPILHSQFQAGAVAGCEKFPLASVAPVPDRPRRMDHIPAGQTVSPRDLCLSCPAAMKGAALRKKLGPCCPVDGSVHASAAQKTRVCRIYNSINFCDLCDITGNGTKLCFKMLKCFFGKNIIISFLIIILVIQFIK